MTGLPTVGDAPRPHTRDRIPSGHHDIVRARPGAPVRSWGPTKSLALELASDAVPTPRVSGWAPWPSGSVRHGDRVVVESRDSDLTAEFTVAAVWPMGGGIGAIAPAALRPTADEDEGAWYRCDEWHAPRVLRPAA